MQAITVRAVGDSQELVLTQVDEPEPGAGEVRVRVVAAGVNRADILQRRGLYPPPKGVTDILGLEVSGWIDQIGVGTETDLSIEEPVVALLAGGGYAEYVVVPADHCTKAPASMTLIEAAAIMETAATVVSNFDHIHLATGETILIHGGAGGIGSFAIPYAKYLGAQVFTTVGSADKAEYARTLGADQAIDYHEKWVDKVRDLTAGRGVDAILDIIGAKYLESNLSLLARGGRIIVIGLQGGTKATLNLNTLLTKAATITATSLRFRPPAEKAAIVTRVANQIWPLFDSGTIPLPPITTFPLAQANAAHHLLESGQNRGKIVLAVL